VKFYRDEIYMLLRSYGKQRDGILTYRDFLKMLTPRLDFTGREVPPAPSVKAPEMVSAATHSRICEHFRKLLEAEQLFESLRQRLTESPGFTNHQAFQKIDRDRDGFISAGELKVFMGEHEGLTTLLEKLDKDADGKISFADFVDEWTPRSPRPM
jgi:Ca2+-binding EF-hand superfamily protein